MDRKKTVMMVMGVHFAAIVMIGYISGCSSASKQQASIPRARIRDDFGQYNNYSAGRSYASRTPVSENPQSALNGYDSYAQSSRTMMANSGASGYTTHVVAKGETLYAIGRKYNVSYKEIAAANSINNPNDLTSGKVIRVPVTSSSAPSTTMIAKDTKTTAPKPAEKETQVARTEPKSEPMPTFKPVAVSAVHGTPTYAIHVVQSGENIWRIAKKYDVSVQSICSINGIDQSSDLNEGDRIKIPVN